MPPRRLETTRDTVSPESTSYNRDSILQRGDITPAAAAQSPTPQLNHNRRGPGSGDASRLADLLECLDRTPRPNQWRLRKNSPTGTYRERFWARVEKTDGCWLWTGPVNQFGYGQFSFRGHTIHVQRVSYAIAYGVPASGLCVCHHCDVRNCVRPEHLFAGTVGDNLRDMVRKGRHPEQVLKRTQPVLPGVA